MMRRTSMPVLLALALFCSPAQAADGTAALRGLIEDSVRSYEDLEDYRALFVKRESSKGVLGEEERIFFKFEKPFKLFMKWLNTDKKGLQVLYERGRHDGKLAIHQPGLLLGLAQVVFLDRSSPWVRQGSESYDIEDAGIGTFLTDFDAMTKKAAEQGRIEASVTEEERGRRVDVRFPGTNPEDEGYFAYRVVALFDGKSGLPVEMTLYDWQERVSGIYAYEDLSLNIGRSDEAFGREAHRKLMKLYYPEARNVRKVNFASK